MGRRKMFLERRNEAMQNDEANKNGAWILYKAIVPPMIGPTICPMLR